MSVAKSLPLLLYDDPPGFMERMRRSRMNGRRNLLLRALTDLANRCHAKGNLKLEFLVLREIDKLMLHNAPYSKNSNNPANKKGPSALEHLTDDDRIWDEEEDDGNGATH